MVKFGQIGALVWGWPEGEWAGLMLGDTPLFFDGMDVWVSYVVLPDGA